MVTIQSRGGLAGDQEVGVARQRRGDHHALAHVAGELVRIVGSARLRVGDANRPQQRDHPGPQLLAAHILVRAAAAANRSDKPDSQRHRILEDLRDLPHTPCIWACESPIRSRSLYITWPENTAFGSTINRITDIIVTLLPDPDSPTVDGVLLRIDPGEVLGIERHMQLTHTQLRIAAHADSSPQ